MDNREQAADGNDDSPLKIGIYGWRKRCLYFFIILLVVIVIVNLALTIWVLSVMRFNTDGMGKLRINKDEIMMADDGRAMFLSDVYAKVVRSVDSPDESGPKSGTLFLESENQVLLKSGTNGAMVDVSDTDITIRTDRFVVRSSNGNRTFEVTDEEVTFFPDTLRASGILEMEEIYTPKVLSSKSLEIESTEDLVISSNTTNIKALTGGVNIQAIENIRLQSLTGQIYLQASEIYLAVPSTFEGSGPMEVCSCPSGRLFFAEPNATTPCQVTQNQCG